MKYTLDGDKLIIYLAGRIDSGSSETIEREIDDILNENPDKTPTLNLSEVEYISSAGLRIILRLKKRCEMLGITNVSDDVYEIFEMTGFSEIIEIDRDMREISLDGCEIIGEGAKSVVYRLDADTIVKVYKNPDPLPDIKNERRLAKKAFLLGVPTAISYDIVKVGGSYGSVFELLRAETVSSLIVKDSENRDKAIVRFAELLRDIHATKVEPDDMPDIRFYVLSWLDAAAPFLRKKDCEKIRRLVKAVPEEFSMLHCDYHTNNVMVQNGEYILIDMDTLSHGHPIFDIANSYLSFVGYGEYDPKTVEDFLGIPYSLSREVFGKFLGEYLKEDGEYLSSVVKKARLISSVRAIRQAVIQKGISADEKKRRIVFYRNIIEEILPEISTLVF